MIAWETGWGLEALVFLNALGGRVLDILLLPFHHLGGEYGYALLLPAIYWMVDKRAGRRLIILTVITSTVNISLKDLWARPRPFQVAPDRIVPFFIQEGFGIPSGHAMGGTVLGVFAFTSTRSKFLKGLIVFGIFLMGFSRLVHGVHFLQDVLAGWILGLLTAILFLAVESRPVPRMVGALVVAGVAIAAWVVSEDFEARKSLISVVGSLVGSLLGIAAESRFVAFRSEGTVGRRLLRGAVGFPMFALVFFGLSAGFYAIVGESTGAGASVLYFARYILVGFTSLCIVPLVLVALGLAESSRRSGV